MVYGVYAMEHNMERKQIYIAPEQEAQLKYLAKEKHTSVSALIREAVAVYLVERLTPEVDHAEQHPLWGIVGIAGDASLPTDGSVAHDSDLYDPEG